MEATYRGNKQLAFKVLGIISILIPSLLAIIVINYWTQIIPNSASLVTLLPFYICPIGILTGGIAYIGTNGRLSFWGTTLSCLFTFYPIVHQLIQI